MISIGATAAGSNTSEIDGTAFSKWSEGLIDRFTESILEPDGISKLDTSAIDEDALKKEFDGFPPAYSAAQRFTMRIIQTARWAQLQKWGYFEDLKRITNPYYEGIHNQAMDFSKFLTAASEIITNKRKQNIYQTNDLPELVNNNYAVYLTYAFGGTLSNVLIQTTTTPQIRGGGSRGIYAPKEVKSPLSWPIGEARYLQYNDTFIAQGKGVYKNYLNILNNERYKSENLPSSDVGFIPLSFELVLDGISGIKIYNKLNINNTFLPTNYPQSLKFVITKVNHNISNNSWDTSLSTISIPNTLPYPLNLSNALPTSVNTVNTGNVSNTGVTGPQPDNGSQFLIVDGRNRRAIMTLDSLLSELDPVARPSFRKFFEILTERYSGYKAIVNDVRRTWEESYNLKKSNSKNADPGRSQHNYGLAIDINIETPASTTRRTLLKNNKTPWIEEGVDKVAKEANLRWGGDFTGYIDCVHFDFDYNIDIAYRQVTTQAKAIDPTIVPPFTGFTNEVLVKCRKIDNLIKQGKIKLS